MHRILLVADQVDRLEGLARALGREKEFEIIWAHDAEAALESVKAEAPALVVVDELVGVNAFIQTAAVTPLPRDDFHEASEGLGVMAQLPPHPGETDARELLQTLRHYL